MGTNTEFGVVFGSHLLSGEDSGLDIVHFDQDVLEDLFSGLLITTTCGASFYPVVFIPVLGPVGTGLQNDLLAIV
ncbi:hypothetical protein ACFL6U_26790 [Planctomycetota bacterium]